MRDQHYMEFFGESEDHSAPCAVESTLLLSITALALDFSDARKFASSHEYQAVRPKHKESLASAIKKVFSLDVVIEELA